MCPGILSGRFASVRPLLLGIGLALAAGVFAGEVRAEPPIQNAQDAYCRNEARARVFSTPDPQNLGAHEVGRRIYQGCMRRYAGGGKVRRSHGHHRRRYRR